MSTTQNSVGTLSQTQFPLDTSGSAPGNRIVDERMAVSQPALKDFHFVIPKFAPFFGDSLTLRNIETGQTLTSGVDYWPTHIFHGASRIAAQPVYGSIMFFDKTFADIVSMDYQTLGGPYVLDAASIAEIINDHNRNPRITTWEQVVDLPSNLPPIDHDFDLQDLVGMSSVRDAILAVADMIETTANGEQATLTGHMANKANPHDTTKKHVGLGKVQNYGIATKARAVEGLTDDAYMTPLRVRQFLEAYTGQTLYTKEEVDAQLSELENRIAALES